MQTRLRLVLALSLLAGMGERAAHARSTQVLSYPLAEVWSTAVRFIRVDQGYKVREKDEDTGYVLFDVVEGPKTYKASLELIPALDDQGRDGTRAAFSIPDLPRHYEVALLDKLLAKVRDERGTPAQPPPRKPQGERPPSASPDAGSLPRAPMRKDLPR